MQMVPCLFMVECDVTRFNKLLPLEIILSHKPTLQKIENNVLKWTFLLCSGRGEKCLLGRIALAKCGLWEQGHYHHGSDVNLKEMLFFLLYCQI